MQYAKHHKRIAALLVLFVCAMFSLAMTNFTDGVASYGIPLPAGDYITTGKYLFVNNTSNTSQDSYPAYGTTAEKPLRTISYAIGKCTANKGDVIFVAPNHNETLTAAASIALNVAGVRLVGLGTGRIRPTLSWNVTTATANADTSFKISASNTSVENFIFNIAAGTGTSAFGSGVSVVAGVSGIGIYKNTFIVSNDSGGKVINAIYLAGASNSVVADNEFYGSAYAASGVSSLIRIGDLVHNLTIERITGRAYATSTVAGTGGLVSGVAIGVSGFVLRDCDFFNYNSGGSPFWFSTPGAVQGIVRNVYAQGGLGGVTIINLPASSYTKN